MHLRKLAILLLLAPLVLAGCAGSQEQAASLEDKLASKGDSQDGLLYLQELIMTCGLAQLQNVHLTRTDFTIILGTTGIMQED